ncbi:23S rRNA (adenine(2503)-C(2))-methyltransferase RlmN [Granulosicoccaceae sp. 1_MG-2023]|nr:23S rRNA (adenine(2503)-C(2))-methyltransferase RlmN [Granulosicoccaceae sp. 1_MG-2023]
MSESKINLLGLDQPALKAFFADIGDKPYRATQVMKWIYHRHVVDFDDMTDLSKAARETLKAKTEIRLPEVAMENWSADGSCKWLLRLECGNCVEAVYIPEAGRSTLCISSQVGCALDCSFCSTARQGFNRNLSSAEIVGQVYLVNRILRHHPGTEDRQITNIVLMGMGEPLLNFQNLVPALSLFMDDLAFGLSKRKVTVSTSGVVPAMDRLKDAIDVSLAVSLHAANDALRDELVPLNKKYPIKELLAACRRFVSTDHKKHIMFEYVMLAGVNDQPEHAHELVRLLRNFPGKVNLIPFNPFPQSGYQRSDQAAIDRFWSILTKGGILTLKRTTRGDDIDAACGQLAGDVTDKSRRHRKFELRRFGEQ